MNCFLSAFSEMTVACENFGLGGQMRANNLQETI